MMPMDFMQMMNKSYLAKIRVSREYNIGKGSNEYTVENLTADEDIIGKYCSLVLSVPSYIHYSNLLLYMITIMIAF